MSYIPTTWATGDVITADKLNNMEGGIADANDSVFEIMMTGENTVNKTKDEINDAINSGKSVYFIYPGNGGPDSGIVNRLPLVSFIRERIDNEDTPIGPAIGDAFTFSVITDFHNTKAMLFYAEIYVGDETYVMLDSKDINYAT